jgi:hypothetical protein
MAPATLGCFSKKQEPFKATTPGGWSHSDAFRSTAGAVEREEKRGKFLKKVKKGHSQKKTPLALRFLASKLPSAIRLFTPRTLFLKRTTFFI